MPVSPEDEWDYWEKKALELGRTQVESVNAAAAKWSALLAALLGVFGTVAFAGGLTTIDKLGAPWNLVGIIMTTGAVMTAAAGLVALALAGGGLRTTSLHAPLDGLDVKKRSVSQAQAAHRYLKAGRWLAAATIGLVLLGSLLILWFGEAQAADPQRYLAVFNDGAVCGELSEASDGTLSIGGRELDASLTSLTPVPNCPENS